MSMKTMVARAIWDEMRGRAGVKHFFLYVPGKDTEGAFDDHQWWLEEVAGTVIAAMREPTEAMRLSGSLVGDHPWDGSKPSRIYAAMIEAALE